MMNKVTKNTVAIVLFVTICIASFITVRQLTRGQQINNPVINVDNSTTLPTETTTTTTAAQPTQTTEQTTIPITTIPIMSTTVVPVTTTAPTTTTTAPATTTTLPTTTQNNTTTTDKYIQEAVKDDASFSGYKYNSDGNFYYTSSDPWQRNFGFNRAYDFAAQFVFMYFDTARILFRYDNKDWMVEFWKGQYGAVFIGAEIGVYTKPLDRDVEHFDCASDEDALYMDMVCYRKGEEIFSRDYAKYWWCTGFVPGKLDKFSDRSELSFKTRITMKDKKMLKAFVGGLETCEEFIFIEGENYYVDGLDVFIEW